MSLIDNKYEDIDRFIIENSEKWQLDDIKVGLLVSEDGKTREIQIDTLKLSPKRIEAFLDRILSTFEGKNDKLLRFYDRIHASLKPVVEKSSSETKESFDFELFQWECVISKMDEKRQKFRIITSVNDVLRTRLQNVKEAEREELQQMAVEIIASNKSFQFMQETYQKLIDRLISGTVDEEQKLEVFPLKIDRLLEESRKAGRLVTSGKEEWNLLNYAACIGDVSAIERAKEAIGDKLSSELNRGKKFPLFTAISKGQYEFAAALCAAGADVNARSDIFQPLLHRLIRTCRPEQIEFCLRQEGVDLNLKESFDETILHCAVMRGDATIVKLLLGNETIAAQKKDRDIFGRTPLDIALEEKADDVIRLLLGDSTIDVQMLLGYGVKPPDIDQTTVLDKLSQYLKLQKEQDEQKLEYEKDQLSPEDFARRKHEIRDASILSEGQCNGLSLLFQYYVSRGKEDEFYSVLQLFAQWDGTVESLKSKEAVRGLSGNYENLQDLMEQWINDIVWFQHILGDDKEIAFKQSDRVLQFEAVKKDEKDTLRPIVSLSYRLTKEQLAEWLQVWSHFPGNPVEMVGSCHATSLKILSGEKVLYYDPNMPRRLPPFESMDKLAALIQRNKHFALGITRDEIMDEKVLIYRLFTGDQEKNDDLCRTVPTQLIESTSPNGNSKLHFAILFNDNVLFDAQIVQEAASVNTSNKHGQTPLYLAVMYGRKNMVEKLLNLENIDLSKDTNQIDLVNLAIQCGQGTIVKMLIDKGLKISGEHIRLAVESGHQDVLRALVVKGIKRQLIDWPTGDKTKNALHIAVMRQDREMIKILLENGANLLFPDPQLVEIFTDLAKMESVLALIADIREREFLNFIVSLLQDVDKTDKNGFNLLHYATLKGNLPLVELILKRRADLTIAEN